MTNDEFEAGLRKLEYFHGLTIPQGMYSIIRVDGRAFHTVLDSDQWKKPFDFRFHSYMMDVAADLLRELNGIYAYTESDEISVLLPQKTDIFGREVEKLVSISAAIAASRMTYAMQRPVQFDSRVWIGPNEDCVIDYFRWRQSDASRCALNGWAYWLLRKDGFNARGATSHLVGKGHQFKHDLLLAYGVNFADLPGWQKNGAGLWWEYFDKINEDVRNDIMVVSQKRRIREELELPFCEEYAALIDQLMLAH